LASPYSKQTQSKTTGGLLLMKLYPLRPHQVETMRLLRESFANNLKRPLVYLPTGAGKTVIAAHIIAGALDKGRRVTFVAPRINLCDQTARSLMAQGLPKPSIMQADHSWFNAGSRFQIASTQTLTRRRNSIKTDLYIIDEAHLSFKVISDIAEETDTPMIALTATPFTVGLGKIYNNLIKPTSLRGLIDNGFLTDITCYSHSKPDLVGVRTNQGEYDNKQLGERCSDAKLVGDIVSTWLKLGENRQTICFAVNVAHANFLESEFNKVGISCAVVVGSTPKEDRDEYFNSFTRKNIKILISVFVLCEGYDGDVRCLIDAAPTKSEARHTQKIGRSCRIADGKVDAIVLDHSGNMQRLGFPEDIEVEELDDGDKKESAERQEKKAKEKKEKLPKECQKCKHLKRANEHECPKCGFTPKFIENVEIEEGELVKIKGNKYSKDDKQRIFAELKGYQRERMLAGKNLTDGWVANTYKDMVGVWPKGLRDTPSQPSEQVRGFIKHKAIAWARSKNKMKNNF